jgi:hypothetical protein
MISGMNSQPSGLGWLEARLQSLIEGSAARLFPGRGSQQELTRKLVQSMQDGAHPTADGGVLTPNLFRLMAHPDTAYVLQHSAPFLDELTDFLRTVIIEAGLVLSGPLQVRVEIDPNLSPGQIEVLAQDSIQDITPTHGLSLEIDNEPGSPVMGAFLIVNGMDVFPLNENVVNIGRRPDNHLVIDDARISRLHAQLRLVRGRFMVFDLESTGGTFVNGRRISQYTLRPGDVISLAGVPVVFGQDEGDVHGDTKEMKDLV